ncbi:MAG: PAS domain S-box protein, partial [Deltaproteobacteria bacterium]
IKTVALLCILFSAVSTPTKLNQIPLDQLLLNRTAAIGLMAGIAFYLVQHKRWEMRLSEQEKVFRASVDALPAVLSIYDADRRYIFVNSWTAAFSGKRPEELLGKRDEEIFPEEITKKTVPFLQKTMETGERVEAEIEIGLPTGKHTFLSSATPVKDETGALIRIVALAVDVTGQRKLETALKKAEAELSSVFRAAPVALGLLHDRKFVMVNDEFVRMTGYSHDEVKGKSSRMVYATQDEFDRVGRVKYAEVRRRGIGTMESYWARKDGTRVDVLLSSGAVDSADLSKGVIFTALDITERKRSHDEIARQRQLFKTLTENAPDVIFMIDRDMRYTYFNSAVEKETGHSPAYFVGKKIGEIGFPPSTYEIWEHSFHRVLETGQIDTISFSLPSRMGELSMIGKMIPLITKEGRIESVIGFSHDVTSLKNVQKMLEKRAEEAEEGQRILRALMENVPEGIAIADAPDVRIRMISDEGCRLLGCRKEEVIGKPMEEHAVFVRAFSTGTLSAIPPEELLLSKTVREGIVANNQELLLKRPDGTSIFILCNTTPIKDRHGKITGGIITWKDITQLKKAEEVLKRDRQTFERLVMERTRELISVQLQLEHAKRLSDIGQLSAVVAHELRNPLGAIKTAAFNIRRKAKSAPIGQQLEHIDMKIDQSDQIINNLLFYARLKHPHFEPVSIYDALKEAIDSFSRRFEDFAVEQDIFPVKGVMIQADPLQLGEAFVNLISNAHDAVKAKHGKLSVSARLQDAQVRIDFSDNGNGMDEEQIRRAFEPFFTTKSKGTGLGLTVARQVVTLHNGSIDIKSRKDEGTHVTILLPITQHA